MIHSETRLRFLATQKSVEVSALLLRPDHAQWLLVLGHGAGAGMHHPFMQAISNQLADRGIATFRYNFPYMEQENRRPDNTRVLLRTVRQAVVAANEAASDLPLLAGGKSMGGRITSIAAAEGDLPRVRGLVFLGYPLHPAGRPATSRGDHLIKIQMPMLFLQGTRDKLADLALIHPICIRLGKLAELHVVEGADHSFHVLKSSDRDNSLILEELAQAISSFAVRLSERNQSD